MSHRIVLKIGALSAREWNYLYGLFLSDGFAYRVRTTGEVVFCLQGNEKEIAIRIVNLLRRIGLHPRLVRIQSKDMIYVRAYSVSIVDFLPNKKALLSDLVSRERFYEENRLLKVKEGIPFLAGLIDGDGYCGVTVTEEYFRGGLNKWRWSFAQTRYAFLVEYIARFVDSIASGSWKAAIYGRKREIYFHKSAIIRLLGLSIAEYSWKAAQWQEHVDRLQRELPPYFTAGDFARVFKVSGDIVTRWIRDGMLKYSARVGSGRNARYYSSERDLKVLSQKLSKQREELEHIKSNALKLVEVAEILGVSSRSLHNWHRRGMIRATMVREGRTRFMVIPKDDMEKLKKHYLSNRRGNGKT